jgi:hypothetical protein
MPWGDSTGPTGAGPMTGRGLGICGCIAIGSGLALGFGLGRMRRFGRRIGRMPVNDAGFLRRQKKILQKRISIIDKQLSVL